MSAKIIQLQKRASYIYQNIQDKADWDNGKRVFALADGTTQSFNSERWAALITKHFITAPTFKPEKMIDLFTGCARKFAYTPFTFNSNPAIAALEKAKRAKGASATFLGLQFLQNNRVNVINCGDTNLFLIDGKGNLRECFPYATSEELNANNHFLNTVQLTEQKLDVSFFQVKQFSYSKGSIFIMATDALSRLFLKNNETMNEVLKIKNFEMLHNFCMKYWDKKALEEDDISAIIIRPDGNNKVEQIIPSADFSFPKAKDDGFEPTPLVNNTNQIFTDMQMQEIYHQFVGVANDFREVKRNQKITHILVIIAIALSFLNLVCFASYMTFLNKKSNTSPQTEWFGRNKV